MSYVFLMVHVLIILEYYSIFYQILESCKTLTSQVAGKKVQGRSYVYGKVR